MTFPKNDSEFEENTIVSVTVGGYHEYGVEMDTHLHFCFTSHVVPRVGDRIRTYGSFGRPVRGVFLNGVQIYYRTLEEEDERHRQMVEQMHQKEKDEFEENKDALDAKFDALPDVFQRRIARYRRNNPDFRWRFEAYEIFCCEQAVIIANALKTEKAIRDFRGLSWNERKKFIPEFSEEHSGNTFGMACYLAILYVTTPEYIPLDHGSIAALVGCEEFGCPPVPTEELERVKAHYESVAYK